MKGQIAAGNIVIALLVLSFFMLGGITLYSGFLVDNDITPDSTLQDEIDSLYLSAGGESESAQNDSSSVSSNFDSGDNIFIRGSKVLDTVSSAGVIAVNSFDILEQGTSNTQLPTQFYYVLASIVSLIAIFVVAGALWRYDLYR